MKTKSIVIIAGVSFLHVVILAGICVLSGCKSTEVLSPKGYIPAPAENLPTAEPELKLEVSEQPPVVIIDKVEEKVTEAPTTAPTESIILTPVKEEPVKYTVKRGDSFWLIGKKYGVSHQELAAYNNMSLNKSLNVGKVLNIPPGGKLKSSAELKAELNKARKAVSKRRRRKIPAKVIARQPIPTSGTYIVKAGDNPWTISRKFRVKNSDLLAANGLNRSSVLKIGQTLVIPQTSSGTVKTTSTVSSPDSSIAPRTTIEDVTKTTNDILNSVDDPETSTAVKTATTPQTTTETVTDIEEKTTLKEDTPIIGADTVTLDADTTIEKFAAAYKVNIADLERLNPDLPKDGKLKAGLLILMPTK